MNFRKKLFITAVGLAAFFLTFSAGSLQAEEAVTIPELGEMKQFEIPDTDSLRFVQEMRTGWNLGNTFDAFDDEGWFKGSGDAMETAWVGVRTTPELIRAVYDAGFRTLRIPVSWHNHLEEDGQINEAWKSRVREVADYALDLGMYVIVNVHHDNNLSCYYPDSAHYDQSAAWLAGIWQQMADLFADCDEHLILESMNEPRLVGTAYEWNWDKNRPKCQDAADCINRLNQLFVDTIRSSGGNNASRYLMIPSYAGSPYNACDEAFILPKDSAEDRIILETHAYTPFDFALNRASADHTFSLNDQAKKSEIGQFMNLLYDRFIKNGIPVVIDEYGAMEKEGNLQDRVNFAAWYVTSARSRGISCCWWDNHVFSGSGERFGLIDRNTCTFLYPEIVEAILRYS